MNDEFRTILEMQNAEKIAEQGSQLAQKAPLASPTFTGLVTTAGQIKFPATQSASADPNTLDDYEEGTFTPVLFGVTSAGTCQYGSQLGSYTKIGNKVFISIFLNWINHTGSGDMKIMGLPFTVGGNVAGALSAYFIDVAMPSGYNAPLVTTDLTKTEITLAGYNGSTRSLVQVDAAGAIRVSGSYFI